MLIGQSAIVCFPYLFCNCAGHAGYFIFGCVWKAIVKDFVDQRVEVWFGFLAGINFDDSIIVIKPNRIVPPKKPFPDFELAFHFSG